MIDDRLAPWSTKQREGRADVQVFVSWSGERGLALATLLKEWLPEVIQELTLFVSDDDIDKGSSWMHQLFSELNSLQQGIICITPESQHKPWLNFEAGTLAKSVSSSRVRPVLLGISRSEVTGPLSTFQSTIIEDRADTFRLVESLNASCERPLSPDLLQRTFSRSWSEFLQRAQAIPQPLSPNLAESRRTDSDVLAEVLNISRDILRLLPINRSGNSGNRVTAFISANQIKAMNASMRVGDLVFHDTFGVGKVLEIEGDGEKRVAKVDFGVEGPKRLLLRYAPVFPLVNISAFPPPVLEAPRDAPEFGDDDDGEPPF